MSKKKAYVVGTNVSSSLSPTIFQYWFNKYNVDGEYGYIEIKESNFDKEIKSILKNKELVGLNITTPYKERIIPHLGNNKYNLLSLDYDATRIGAVNYILKNFHGDWLGCNSDFLGFDLSIKPFEKNTNKNIAIVIGYGGASKAIIFSLLNKGYKKIKLFNRSYKKIKNIFVNTPNELCIETHKLQDLEKHTHNVDLFINATPTNVLNNTIQWNINPNTIGFDAAYRPREGTGFLNHFKSQKRIEGIYMLAHQAVPCWNAWFASSIKGEILMKNAVVDKDLIEFLFKKIDDSK